jgi:hypothetical protein
MPDLRWTSELHHLNSELHALKQRIALFWPSVEPLLTTTLSNNTLVRIQHPSLNSHPGLSTWAIWPGWSVLNAHLSWDKWARTDSSIGLLTQHAHHPRVRPVTGKVSYLIIRCRTIVPGLCDVHKPLLIVDIVLTWVIFAIWSFDPYPTRRSNPKVI